MMSTHHLSLPLPFDSAIQPDLRPLPAAEDLPRVLLVDDHPVFCDGMRALIEHSHHFAWAGHAATGSAALTLARHCQPGLVVLDIALGEANGLDLINQLRRICPDTLIVVLTGEHTRERLMSAMRLGVEGYLQKDMPSEQILLALRQVVGGERVIGQQRALTAALTEFGVLMRNRERDRLGLSDQELEILRLAASGLNNKLIGQRQFLSEITVKRKMQDIYRKLNVKSRAQAVAEAIRLGHI